jgi:hypothetical protein
MAVPAVRSIPAEAGDAAAIGANGKLSSVFVGLSLRA